MIEIGSTTSFGIDENTFKTRDERRLAKYVKEREHQVEVAEHLQKLERRDQIADARLEEKALQTVGAQRPVTAPSAEAAPSAESSALKAKELRP